jgi:hypothetical protein
LAPEELTNEFSELEQECVAKEEERRNSTSGEGKEAQRKFTVKNLAEPFVDLNKLLQS